MIIVIGAGHNGLIAATLLAQKGHQVRVIEARENIGGISGYHSFGDGFQVPGILHETRCLRPEIVKELKLEKFGLQREAAAPICAPSLAKDPIFIYPDRLEGAFSSKDQENHKKHRQFIQHISPLISKVMSAPSPSMERGLWSMLKTVQQQDYLPQSSLKFPTVCQANSL